MWCERSETLVASAEKLVAWLAGELPACRLVVPWPDRAVPRQEPRSGTRSTQTAEPESTRLRSAVRNRGAMSRRNSRAIPSDTGSWTILMARPRRDLYAVAHKTRNCVFALRVPAGEKLSPLSIRMQTHSRELTASSGREKEGED